MKIRAIITVLIFLLFTLEKHSLGRGLFGLQEIAFLSIGLSYFISIWVFGIQRLVLLFLSIINLSVVLFIFTMQEFEQLANLSNSLLIILSFPVALQIARYFRAQDLRLLTTIFVGVVVIFTVVGGLVSGWTVSYLGDTRQVRLIGGWEKPTFLAEAACLIIFLVITSTRDQQLSGVGKWPQTAKIVILVAVLTIIATGSRAALGTSLIFLYSVWLGTNRRENRILLNISFLAVALLFVFWSINQGISIDTLDRAAGSRWTMISVEIETHLITLGYWLFGNHDAYMVFLENDVFQNRVFHIDSFFAERLVLTGLFGLILLGLSILNFYSNMDLVGRAVVVSLLFYGLFEHGIFNLTSMFAYFSLLIAAISAQKALFRRARLSADAAHGTALRPAR